MVSTVVDPVMDADEREEQRWRAVSERLAASAFLYGVVTTGVYCRPACPSRRPLRRNVRFFDDADAAEAAGFRACRRCRPGADSPAADAAVLAACLAMDAAGGPAPIAELAAAAGCSERQLQRRFVQAAGVTPRAYGQAVRVGRARAALVDSPSVLDAAFAVGYGSARAFYEEAPVRLAMRPSSYARRGEGEVLRWTAGSVEIGEALEVLVVASAQGVTAVRIGPDRAPLLVEVAAELSGARLEQDDEGLAPVLDAVLALAAGGRAAALPLDVRGTAFQAAVWEAVRAVPAGEVRTYGEIAAAVGRPSAVRAVARAVGANPAALVVPCHRVVRADRTPSGYRWGLAVKAALLAREAARPAGPAGPVGSAGSGR
ncbi:MAG: methylated-DNA--[protein]-cysteine S-methyltransferase [Acidimicrobiales bacterium]